MSKESPLIPADPIYSSIFPNKLRKGDRKKLEIVTAAIGLFAEKGVENTSYDDLAKALKTNRSHISYHFKEHQDLILSVIRHMMNSGHEFTFESLRKAQTARDQFVGYISAFCDFFAAHPEYVTTFLYFYYSAGLPGEIRDLQTQVRQQAYQRINALIRNLFFECNKLGPRDLDQMAFQVQALLLGGAVLNIATGAKVNVQETSVVKQQLLQGMEKIIRLKLITE